MKYSVIIPCYSASTTIEVALESLVLQHERDFEVIIIDDASTDFEATQAIIALYMHRLTMVVLRNTVNKNGSFARNRGIQQARGDHVAFLDADDRWPADRLSTANVLLSTMSTSRFIVYGRFELLRERPSGALLPLRGIKKGESVAEYVFAAGQHMQTSTFLCPRSIAKEVLFDESLTRHQDSDFMMRAQARGIDLIFQAQKCAFYYFRDGDLRRRIKAGRINSSFCENWLKVKGELFSRKAKAGYELTISARIAHLESGFPSFIKILLKSIFHVGIFNLIDLMRTKVHVIFKTRFGL